MPKPTHNRKARRAARSRGIAVSTLAATNPGAPVSTAPVPEPVLSVSAESAREPDRKGTLREWQILAVVTLAAALLCAGLYGWTLDFPLEFDDYVYLVENPVFPDPASFHYFTKFTEFANKPLRMGYDGDFAVNFVLRPAAYGSFYLNYLLDEFRPRFYRLVNVFCHACSGVLIFALLRLLLRQAGRVSKLPEGSAWFIPAVGSLLFLAHPMAIESVTYVVQRFTSMATTFALLALWLHFLALQANSRLAGRLLEGGAVVAILLGMQTKECCFMVPFMAVLWHHLVGRASWRKAGRSAWPLLACTPLIPFLVVLLSVAQNQGWLTWEQLLNIVNRKEDPFAHWHYLVTQWTVLAYYLRLLAWPTGLNLDPDWPLYQTIWQGPVLGALALIAGMLGGAVWAYRRGKGAVRPALLLASVLWFFATIQVSSGLLPLPDLVAEHRSYLPSIGIFTAAAVLLDWLRTSVNARWALRWVVPAGAAVGIAALSWATCARNEVWRSAVALWSDTAAKSPDKSRAWGNLGTAYAREGNQEEAVRCYERAIAINPQDQTDLRNLAISLLHLSRPGEALQAIHRLAEINRGNMHVSVAEVAGAALLELNRFQEAAEVYRQILASHPGHLSALLGMGMVYQKAGYPAHALDHYYSALKYYPEDQRVVAAIAGAQEAARMRSASVQ